MHMVFGSDSTLIGRAHWSHHNDAASVPVGLALGLSVALVSVIVLVLVLVLVSVLVTTALVEKGGAEPVVSTIVAVLVPLLSVFAWQSINNNSNTSNSRFFS
jgi:hypothetical protein